MNYEEEEKLFGLNVTGVCIAVFVVSFIFGLAWTAMYPFVDFLTWIQGS